MVTKIPRFTFEKFPGSNTRLTTQMKSVGEVMAIGRTFQESLQKALRGLETGLDGLNPQLPMPLLDESRDLLAHETIVRHVLVEAVDDVVTIAPGLFEEGPAQGDRLAEPRHVEPVPAPALAESR